MDKKQHFCKGKYIFHNCESLAQPLNAHRLAAEIPDHEGKIQVVISTVQLDQVLSDFFEALLGFPQHR